MEIWIVLGANAQVFLTNMWGWVSSTARHDRSGVLIGCFSGMCWIALRPETMRGIPYVWTFRYTPPCWMTLNNSQIASFGLVGYCWRMTQLVWRWQPFVSRVLVPCDRVGQDSQVFSSSSSVCMAKYSPLPSVLKLALDRFAVSCLAALQFTQYLAQRVRRCCTRLWVIVVP